MLYLQIHCRLYEFFSTAPYRAILSNVEDKDWRIVANRVSFKGHFEYKLSDKRGGRSQGEMLTIDCTAVFEGSDNKYTLTMTAGKRKETVQIEWVRKGLPGKKAASQYLRTYAPRLLPPNTKFLGLKLK